MWREYYLSMLLPWSTQPQNYEIVNLSTGRCEGRILRIAEEAKFTEHKKLFSAVMCCIVWRIVVRRNRLHPSLYLIILNTMKMTAVGYPRRSWPWHSGRNELKEIVAFLFYYWDLGHSFGSLNFSFIVKRLLFKRLVYIPLDIVFLILRLLDRASFRYLKNKRPTCCHLLFYFTSYVLNTFRTLICPTSGACDCVVELPHWSFCSCFAVCWTFGAVGFE